QLDTLFRGRRSSVIRRAFLDTGTFVPSISGPKMPGRRSGLADGGGLGRRGPRLLLVQPRERGALVAVGAHDRAHRDVEEYADADRGDQRRDGGPDVHAVDPRPAARYCCAGFTSGKRMVSRMPRPVSAMRRRSMPRPMPPDGGMAYSIAVRKSSSMRMAS